MLGKLKLQIPVFARMLSADSGTMVGDVLRRLESKLESLGVVPEFRVYKEMDPRDFPQLQRSAPYHVCMLATGGTESLCVDYAYLLHKSSPEKPIIILTHPNMNSLAAGLEAKAKLAYEQAPAHLFNISDMTEMKSLFSVLRARDYLTQEGEQLGIVGQPSDWLVSSDLETIGSKSEVWGMRVRPDLITMQEVLDAYEEIPKASPEVQEVVRYFISKDSKCAALGTTDGRNKWLWDNARFCVALNKIVGRYSLFGLTLRCYDLIPRNITGCLAVSYLNDHGIPSACEGDIPAMVTMMLAFGLTNQPSFMANSVHYSGKTLLLAHCTIPTKLAINTTLRTHFESGKGAAIQADLLNADKVWTVSRGNLWENSVACEEVVARNVSAKSERRCRTQVLAEFPTELSLATYMRLTSGNHQVLTEGAWASHFHLYKDLFIR